MEEKLTAQFKVGTVYTCNSIGDLDCKWSFKILKRTMKSVWIKDYHSKETVRKSISIYNKTELIFPLGKYSMSPILRANKANINN